VLAHPAYPDLPQQADAAPFRVGAAVPQRLAVAIAAE
jgi:hypothetical protein